MFLDWNPSFNDTFRMYSSNRFQTRRRNCYEMQINKIKKTM